LRHNCNAEKVILKLGREGIIMHSYDKKKNLFETDRMESFNLNPVDVAGAGDSLLVGSSMALALGAGLKEAALIGSILSAIQISREGNSPISKNELFSVI
jgi:sugar/nucleoside kinase (ribokinase family)